MTGLSEQQKLTIHRAYVFSRSAIVYLQSCLPTVREEDGRHLQSLIELGEHAISRIVEHFTTEIDQQSRGGRP